MSKPSDHDPDDSALCHEELVRAGLFDAADVAESPDDGWPDDFVWDLGDGVTATTAELRDDEPRELP